MDLYNTIQQLSVNYKDNQDVTNALAIIINTLDKKPVYNHCKDHGYILWNEIDPCDIPF